MDNEALLAMMHSVSVERDLPKEEVFSALEEGLAAATKRSINDDCDIIVRIDRNDGSHRAFRRWKIVDSDFALKSTEENEDEDEDPYSPERHVTVAQAKEQWPDEDFKVGDERTEEIPPAPIGRIVAQAARQALFGHLRRSERQRNAENHRDSIGKIITGTVKKVVTRGGEKVILDLAGGAEAILPRKYQMEADRFHINDTVVAVLEEIEDAPRGPMLVLSRTSPELVRQLLVREVPEVSERIIDIKAISREAGSCTKVAVKTNDSRIDPVGACVGMRGLRIHQVMSSINDERVDVVAWNDDPVLLALNALGPYKPDRVIADENKKTLDVVIGQEQHLARSIGRSGQNVRLASKLSGWAINIMDPKQAERQEQEEGAVQAQTLMQRLNIDLEKAERLLTAGITEAESLLDLDVEELGQILEATEEEVENVQLAAADAMMQSASHDASGEEGPDEDILALDGMVAEFAYSLAKAGVRACADFADMGVDDVLDLVPDADADAVGNWIMAARQAVVDKQTEEGGAEESA